MARFWVVSFFALGAALSAGLGSARAQGAASCASSTTVLFNHYGNAPIAAGSTIWFSSVLEGVAGPPGTSGKEPIRIDVRESRITFGRSQHAITLPDSTIVLDPSTGEPQRWWVDNSYWALTYAPSQIPEAFYDGMPFEVPEAFVPDFSGPVTWTATFTASRPGVTLRWAWSAAAYSQFGVNGRLLVKPLTVPVMQFQNRDPAGTPELFKQFVVAGAMGTGAPQYTGARSDTVTVGACLASAPPETSPAAGFSAPRLRPIDGLTVYLFASPVAQRLWLSDRSLAVAVDRCYAADLCAAITYRNGDRLSIYYEGAVRHKPRVLYFERSNGTRTIFAFSRELGAGNAPASMLMEGGRVRLTISVNADGSLRFYFTSGTGPQRAVQPRR